MSVSAEAIPKDMVWFDGSLVLSSEVRIAPFTHSLHYGSGVFEGIRAYATPSGSKIFRLNDHLRRLFYSAETYGLRINYSIEELAAGVCETLRANDFESGYIRPLVFFGERGISLAPQYSCPTHVLIALKPLSGSLVGGALGARVTISHWQKSSTSALPSTVKACGHYANSVLALHDAFERGFDEAILLNQQGRVAEGTGENIFLVKNGRLITNDSREDILNGITRETVLTLADDMAIRTEIRPIEVRELFDADELFFTGTAAEILPIIEIDGYQIQTSEVTSTVKRAYAAATSGENRHHPEWTSSLSPL